MSLEIEYLPYSIKDVGCDSTHNVRNTNNYSPLLPERSSSSVVGVSDW